MHYFIYHSHREKKCQHQRIKWESKVDTQYSYYLSENLSILNTAQKFKVKQWLETTEMTDEDELDKIISDVKWNLEIFSGKTTYYKAQKEVLLPDK